MVLKLDTESENNLENLIKLIGSDQCCVFIGSGLSIAAGFPSWAELVERLRIDAIQAIGHDPCDSSQSNWEKAEIYRGAIGEEIYFQNIISAFEPAGKDRYRPIHQLVIRIPFHAYVTTNYDLCLENAANNLDRQVLSYYYPELDPSYLREGHVFHVHGVLDPENPRRTVGTLILTERDYQRAYVPETSLPTFLSSLFCYHTVVFIGYSLKDIDLVRVIQRVQVELEERGVFELEQGIGRRKQNNHFVIMHQGGDEAERNLNLDAVKALGLIPVFYNGESVRHTELEAILDIIRLRTSDLVLPQPVIIREMFDGG